MTKRVPTTTELMAELEKIKNALYLLSQYTGPSFSNEPPVSKSMRYILWEETE